ncbi:MAG: hypothetical protein GY810_32355 [Aureispira sp.]|nr:hypothetical protein [Aureispira sp.]
MAIDMGLDKYHVGHDKLRGGDTIHILAMREKALIGGHCARIDEDVIISANGVALIKTPTETPAYEEFNATQLTVHGEGAVLITRFNNQLAVCAEAGPILITKEQVMRFFNLEETTA